MSQMIVDIHPHVITTDEVRYPRNPLGGKQSVWSQQRPTTWQQLIQAMDEAGVAKAAIVQSSTCYGFDNSYVAEAVLARPERFTGVCSIDMLAANAPETLRYWKERGMTGLRLFTTGSTMPGQSDVLADPRSFAAWEAANALQMSVCVQMRPEGLPMLETLIARFPNVRIIIDHLMSIPVESGPPYSGAAPLISVARHPNIYLKLTTVALREACKGSATPQGVVALVAKHFGSHRIAWGSNFPASEGTLTKMVAEAREAVEGLSEPERQHVLGQTALSLYPALH